MKKQSMQWPKTFQFHQRKCPFHGLYLFFQDECSIIYKLHKMVRWNLVGFYQVTSNFFKKVDKTLQLKQESIQQPSNNQQWKEQKTKGSYNNRPLGVVPQEQKKQQTTKEEHEEKQQQRQPRKIGSLKPNTSKASSGSDLEPPQKTEPYQPPRLEDLRILGCARQKKWNPPTSIQIPPQLQRIMTRAYDQFSRKEHVQTRYQH